MDHPPEHLPDDPQAELCRAEWLRRRQRQRVGGWILMGWVLVVTIFVLLLGFGVLELPTSNPLYVFPFYFVPVLIFGMFNMINGRCPRCNQGLGRVRNPRFCFNCGLKLRE